MLCLVLPTSSAPLVTCTRAASTATTTRGLSPTCPSKSFHLVLRIGSARIAALCYAIYRVEQRAWLPDLGDSHFGAALVKTFRLTCGGRIWSRFLYEVKIITILQHDGYRNSRLYFASVKSSSERC
nr:hypothetical protein CFP56_52464 [Quercus suber]